MQFTSVQYISKGRRQCKVSASKEKDHHDIYENKLQLPRQRPRAAVTRLLELLCATHIRLVCQWLTSNPSILSLYSNSFIQQQRAIQILKHVRAEMKYEMSQFQISVPLVRLWVFLGDRKMTSVSGYLPIQHKLWFRADSPSVAITPTVVSSHSLTSALIYTGVIVTRSQCSQQVWACRGFRKSLLFHLLFITCHNIPVDAVSPHGSGDFLLRSTI